MRIVFDLDGTLIDSAPDIHAAALAVLASEGLAPITLEQAISFVGNGARALVARAERATAGDSDPQRLERMTRHFLEIYEHSHSLTRLYPAAAETLAVLATGGWRLGLCTNKPIGPARQALAHFGWQDRFEAVIGAGMLPAIKPDPAPLHAVLAALGEGPAVYVGDSEVDAATAQAAGVPFALFTEGYRKSPVEAIPHDARFDDFRQLPEIAARLIDRAAAQRG